MDLSQTWIGFPLFRVEMDDVEVLLDGNGIKKKPYG